MERVRLARSNGLLHPERRVAIFGGDVGDYDPPDPMEKAARRAAEVYPKPQTLNPKPRSLKPELEPLIRNVRLLRRATEMMRRPRKSFI